MIFTAITDPENRQRPTTWQEWRDTAIKQIKFKPDRGRVERELQAHYEDHCLDLERLGWDKDLAAERALRAMGDPLEVGHALDQAHTTIWNQLWLVSKALLVACAIWLIAQAVTNPDAVSYAWRNVEESFEGACFYEGLSPLLDPELKNPSHSPEETAGLTFLSYADLPEAVEAGDYRIEPKYGCWWRDADGDDWLCLVLITEDAKFPWTAPAPMFWQEYTVEGSRSRMVSTTGGRELRGSYLHWLTVEMEGSCDRLEICYDRGTWPLSLWVEKEAVS